LVLPFQQSNGTQRDGFEYANTWTVGSAPVAEKFTTINAGVKRRKGMVSAPDVELPTRRDGSELVTTTRSASFPPKGAAGPGTVALNHAGIMSFRAPDTRSTSNANKEDSMLPSVRMVTSSTYIYRCKILTIPNLIAVLSALE
jgi:hypothetical protein